MSTPYRLPRSTSSTRPPKPLGPNRTPPRGAMPSKPTNTASRNPRFHQSDRNRHSWTGGGSSDPYAWMRLEGLLNTRLFDDDERPLPGFDAGLGAAGGRPSWRSILFHAALSVLGLGQGSLHPEAPLHQAMGFCAFFQLGAVGFFGASWTVHCLYLLASRMVHKYRRPSYYNAEAERRAAKLLAQRSAQHRIRHRSSILHPPSKEELLEAWGKAAKRGATEEKLQLGALMATIEAVVDNSLVRDGAGTIIGRRGGVKEWLLQNCPRLLPHYSALMHYKALADKVQRACGLADPDPVGAVLGGDGPTTITVGPKLLGTGSGEAFELQVDRTCIRCIGVKITVGPEWKESFRERVRRGRDIARGLREDAGNPKNTGVPKSAENQKITRKPKSTGNPGDSRISGDQGVAGNQGVAGKHGISGDQGVPGDPWGTMASLEAVLYRRLGIIREKRLHHAPHHPRGSLQDQA